jgi:putative transposase
MVSVPARRSQVAFATGRGLSQRRACTLVKVGRSALRYRSLKTQKDAPVLARMVKLAAQYPRYGYRRERIFLGRDGHKMSFGRAYRLWKAAKLQVPRKRPRKRIATGRPRPQAPTGANQVWSYDFVLDWCVWRVNLGETAALPRQNCSRIMTVASLELLPRREPGGGRDEAGQHGDEG